jgi:hypothetical protein
MKTQNSGRMQKDPAQLLSFVSLLTSSKLFFFYSTLLYQKDERALPGNLHSRKFFFPFVRDFSLSSSLFSLFKGDGLKTIII